MKQNLLFGLAQLIYMISHVQRFRKGQPDLSNKFLDILFDMFYFDRVNARQGYISYRHDGKIAASNYISYI